MLSFSTIAHEPLIQKIIARAAGKSHVAPGDIVTCKVDLAMFHDSSGPRRIAPRLKELGAKIWDPSKVVVVSDQAMLAECAYLRPGSFCVGGESHARMGGAFGCYMAGFGATELTGVMATGKIWTRVPESMLVCLSGSLRDGTTAKDIMLFLCRLLGTHNSLKVIEYRGSTIEQLPMSERMVLTDMAAELGADTAVIAPDAVTLNAIRNAGGAVDDEAASSWHSDAGAMYESRYDLDASMIEPQIARPHSAANSFPITHVQGARIEHAYIGACGGATLADLHMAARVLKDRKVTNGVRLLIATASAQIARLAAADGTLTSLVEAGSILLPAGSGVHARMGAGVLSDGDVRTASMNRDEIYFGSPYTVAASAITGSITDPRPYLEGRAV